MNCNSFLFRGIGEPKYMPVAEWPALNKILSDALTSYNELNAAMDLVIFNSNFNENRDENIIISFRNTLFITFISFEFHSVVNQSNILAFWQYILRLIFFLYSLLLSPENTRRIVINFLYVLIKASKSGQYMYVKDNCFSTLKVHWISDVIFGQRNVLSVFLFPSLAVFLNCFVPFV